MDNCNLKFVLNNHFVLKQCTAHDGRDTPADFHCRKGLRKWSRFFYLVKGEVEFVSHTGKRITISDGDILFLPYDIEYSSSWKKNEGGYYYSVEFVLQYPDGEILNLYDDIAYVFGDNGHYKRLFAEIAMTATDGSMGFRLRLQEQFMHLLYMIAMTATKESVSDIQPAISVIESDLCGEMNVNELARLCHLSPATFRRRFLKYASMSPVSYRNYLRMNKARELILTGLYTVNQVAETVGFSDVCYFSKMYKKQFGVAPSMDS